MSNVSSISAGTTTATVITRSRSYAQPTVQEQISEIVRIFNLNRTDFKMTIPQEPDYKNLPMDMTSTEMLVRVFVKDVKPEKAWDYVISKVPAYNMNLEDTTKILASLGFKQPVRKILY